MTYKTVLAYFGLSGDGSDLLDAALPLARDHGAHLIGLAIIPPVNMYVALAGEISDKLVEVQRAVFRQRAEVLAEEFERRTRNENIAAEWRCLESGPLGIADTAVRQSANADLVITRQTSPLDDWELLPAVPERLLMECRRPMLMIPHSGAVGAIGKNVLIGWNGRNEAARAIFDALPILQKASNVEITTVGRTASSPKQAFTPADSIAASLARHGVDVEVFAIAETDLSEGQALLQRAKDQACDLLVIGGYGHSRVSEFIFGGVTRHVLTHMTLPVLMSH